jgi:hypothetical protein
MNIDDAIDTLNIDVLRLREIKKLIANYTTLIENIRECKPLTINSNGDSYGPKFTIEKIATKMINEAIIKALADRSEALGTEVKTIQAKYHLEETCSKRK